jgi:hypothetical protein
MFEGIIIEESLEDKSPLKHLHLLKTEIEPVTASHRTPWVKQWTMHTVQIVEKDAQRIAEELSHALDSKHHWYADFKDEQTHFIIYKNKVFRIKRNSKEAYDEATRYGISVGIPEYQVDFSPHVKAWTR